jgi:NADH-quinone oxidoreductase subunit L
MGTTGWIVLGLPLLGSIILALYGSKEPPKAVTRWVGCGSIGLAFILTVDIFIRMLGDAPEERVHVSRLWEWIQIGDLTVDLAIRIDQLSVMMMLVITGVGFLIHVYSTEYMDHEPGYRRFFAEMNFFVFSMLLLVEAANFIFLIVGWAFVGLASYLLIGFYYDRPVAVAAAKKAFVINVIGDVGMVIAAFLLARDLGTLDYTEVFATAPETLTKGGGVAVAIALLLFVGAAAKSAQVPLHTWLPDAMEGPTPVSALIHAATMVTAGVYLIVRTHVLYELAPVAMDIVAVVGCITLVMAATIAIAQQDIKRVLAWSTVSQIGYMIMAAGLGAYSSGMFHFLTHAFFKALLFLAAGIVIHALAGEQSLDRMGGLHKHLRFAYMAIAIGCLAIAGVPGFAGFFSKDDILAHALAHGGLGVALFVFASIAAFLTAFYMFRLLFRVFHATEPEGGYRHAPHGAGWAMSAPVGVLAVLSVAGGWLQVPFGWHTVTDWLDPVFADSLLEPLEPTHAQELATIIVSLSAAVLGILLAWHIFARDPGRRVRAAAAMPQTRALLEDAYRFDDVYDELVVQPGRFVGERLRDDAEPLVIQAPVGAVAVGLRGIAAGLGRLQNGLVRSYAFAMVAGVVGVAVTFIMVRR